MKFRNMLQLLIFLLYLIIPILLLFIYRKYEFNKIIWYVILIITILLYPFLLFYLDEIINERNIKCYNPRFSILMGNTFIMLPITLLYQFILNKIFLKK